MMALGVLVAVFELLRRGMKELDVVGRAKFRGRGRTALEVSHCRLDKPRLPSLRAVKHFEDKVRGALIDDYTTLANICW